MSLAIDAIAGGDGIVTLNLTGAAHVGTVVYASNFASGVDSWAGGVTGASAVPSVDTAPKDGYNTLRVGYGSPFIASDQYAKRTITGLTIGVTYRVTAKVIGMYSGWMSAIGVAGIGTSGLWVTGPPGWTTLTYDFVATATSHDLRLTRNSDPINNGVAYLRDVVVAQITAGYGPLQIQRTDANGTHYVRLPVDAEPNSSGNFTIDDYEAALVGSVSYTVRDGLGFTATDFVTDVGAALLTDGYGATIGQVGLQAFQVASAVLGYDEARTYQALTIDPKAIIGREDFTAAVTDDYGWSKRKGTLRLLTRNSDGSYNSVNLWDWANAIAEVYTSGRVALLRQHLYPGMDLYHVATEVRIVPEEVHVSTTGEEFLQVWVVEVDYVEVAYPAGSLTGTTDWIYTALGGAYLAYWNLAGAGYADYVDLAGGP